MRQNSPNPCCITHLPNALSVAFVPPRKNYATLSAERKHPKDDVQISDVHAVDSKHMQLIETTVFKLGKIQSGVEHCYTQSTYCT